MGLRSKSLGLAHVQVLMKSLNFILLELESHWGWISGEKIEASKGSKAFWCLSHNFTCTHLYFPNHPNDPKRDPNFLFDLGVWDHSSEYPKYFSGFLQKWLVNFSHAVILQNGSLSNLRSPVGLLWKHNFTTVLYGSWALLQNYWGSQNIQTGWEAF